MANSNQYSAEAIEVLQGLDPVRKRPGMYTETSRPNHLAQEVIDKAGSPPQAIGVGVPSQIDFATGTTTLVSRSEATGSYTTTGVTTLARRAPRVRSTVFRLAVGNIHRPGALTPAVVLSLGLGLTLLVALATGFVGADAERERNHSAEKDRADGDHQDNEQQITKSGEVHRRAAVDKAG